MKVLSNDTIKYIYHLADIHIRPLDRHSEYKEVFKNLTNYLLEQNDLDESLIVICGDLVHEKDKITPELIILLRDFLNNLSLIMPVILFSGNHDLIENNSDRMANLDALTRDLTNIHYLKYTDLYEYGNIVFSLNSLEDTHYFKVNPDNDKIKIALYHGMLQEISFSKGGISVEDFEMYDFVLLGDVHERQFLKKNIAYSGSLIQQNFGEAIEHHGLIKWDILNKESECVDIKNVVGYVTINNEIIPDLPKYSHIRLKLTEDIESETILNEIRNRTNVLSEKVIKFKNESDKIQYEEEFIENISDDQIIKENVEESDYDKIIELHKTIKLECNFNNEKISEYKWSIQNIEFKNLFIYGNNVLNKITLSDKNGVIGVLGKNAIGKSTIINIIIFALFDKISSEYNSANIINKNSKNMYVKVEFTIGNTLYVIIKEGSLQKNGYKTKFITNYFKIENGNEINLNGKDKIKTQQLIEETIGGRDMFKLCNVVSHNNNLSIMDMSSLGAIQTFSNLLSLDKYETLFKNISSKIKTLNEELIKEESIYSLLKKYTEKELQLLTINISKKNEHINSLEEQLKHKETNYEANKIKLQEVNSKIINIIQPKNTKEQLLINQNSITKQLSEYNDTYDVVDTLEHLYNSLYNSNENLNDIELKLKKSLTYEVQYSEDEYQTLYLQSKLLENELNKSKNDIKLYKSSDDCYVDFTYDELIKKKMDCKLKFIDTYKEIVNVDKNKLTKLEKTIKQCEDILFFNCNKIANESKKLLFFLKKKEFYLEDKDVFDTKQTNKIIQELINFFDKVKSTCELDEIRKQLQKDKLEYNSLNETINKNNENTKYNLQIDNDKKYNEKTKNELIYIERSISHLKFTELTNKIEKLEKNVVCLHKELEKMKGSINYFKLKDLYNKLVNNKTINEKITFLKLTNELSDIKKELVLIDTYEKTIIQNKEYEGLKTKLEKEIMDDTVKIIKFKEELSKLHTEIKYETKQKHDMEKELLNKNTTEKNIKSIKERLLLFSIYKKLVDKKCIPALILQKKLEFIQKDINLKLSNLVKFKIKMYIDSESRFNLDIIKFDNILKPYMCSGYERFILNIMIKNSLNRFCYNNKSNIFCIDEGLDCIDDDNLNKFKIVLERLQRTYDHIILISQIDRINKYIDYQLNIEHKNNTSFIKV